MKRLLALLLCVISIPALADGPCPDGQFNPQATVCMCPGGGYVAPNNYCKTNTGPVVSDYYGAISLVYLDYYKNYNTAFAESDYSQRHANSIANVDCGYRECRVALEFKNSCGAVALSSDRVYETIKRGNGVDRNLQKARRKAIAECLSLVKTTTSPNQSCQVVESGCAGVSGR